MTNVSVTAGLPPSLTMETRTPVAAADVEPWLAVIIRLADDHEYYATASARALAAAEPPTSLQP